MRYSISTHSGEFLVWSGALASDYEGCGTFRYGAKRTTVTLNSGEKVIVRFPEGITLPRNEENYQIIDQAISDAIERHNAL